MKVIGLFLLLLKLASPAFAEPAQAGPCPAILDDFSFRLGEWGQVLVLDATGDGLRDVFIADPDRGGNAGEPWLLYRRLPAGGYREVGSVFFHPGGFRLVGTRLETYWRANATSGTFITYRISDESITEIEKTDRLFDNDPEYERRWQAILDWRPNLKGAWFAAQQTEAGERRCLSLQW